MADSVAAAREVYQALYTLNRLELPVQTRLKLMQLYRDSVGVISNALQPPTQNNVLPVTPQKRQVVEFVRQLQMEMAHGYKLVLRDIERVRFMWGKRQTNARALEWAIHYLGEVLCRSYQAYMACPRGVWRELHALYTYGETNKWFGEAESDTHPRALSRYLRVLFLGLANPYQLPETECRRVDRFLQRWVDESHLHNELAVSNPAGHFLLDLSVDAPPSPFPKDVSLKSSSHLRTLDALGLARRAQSFINKLKKGEPAQSLDMGMECLDNACLDILRRMVRFWGLGVRRQGSRKKRKGHCFVALGINALHFFVSGQESFSPPDQTDSPANLEPGLDLDEFVSTQREKSMDETYIDLAAGHDDAEAEEGASLADSLLAAGEVYRVDRWQIRDESMSGLLLASRTARGTRLRVGELLGIQDVSESDSWRVGVIRWLKTPSRNDIEMGVEMLSPSVAPVAVRRMEGGSGSAYMQALLLAPQHAIKRPASLIIPRGAGQDDAPLLLAEVDGQPRQIKPIEVLEHTGSFEYIVFADLASHGDRTMDAQINLE